MVFGCDIEVGQEGIYLGGMAENSDMDSEVDGLQVLCLNSAFETNWELTLQSTPSTYWWWFIDMEQDHSGNLVLLTSASDFNYAKLAKVSPQGTLLSCQAWVPENDYLVGFNKLLLSNDDVLLDGYINRGVQWEAVPPSGHWDSTSGGDHILIEDRIDTNFEFTDFPADLTSGTLQPNNVESLAPSDDTYAWAFLRREHFPVGN